MKPYGIPRDPELEYPDIATIQKFAFKSCCGRIAGRRDDFRPYVCGANKARTRRIWKRKARAEGRVAIQEGLTEWKLQQPEQPSECPSQGGSYSGAGLSLGSHKQWMQ
ncbi:MAG: hypothetical protein ACLQVJ_14900 [Syntrophobacteraceae bacterium]